MRGREEEIESNGDVVSAGSSSRKDPRYRDKPRACVKSHAGLLGGKEGAAAARLPREKHAHHAWSRAQNLRPAVVVVTEPSLISRGRLIDCTDCMIYILPFTWPVDPCLRYRGCGKKGGNLDFLFWFGKYCLLN